MSLLSTILSRSLYRRISTGRQLYSPKDTDPPEVNINRVEETDMIAEKNIPSDPDRVLRPDKYEKVEPYKNKDKTRLGIDKAYEEFFEVKDYDREGQVRRSAFSELQSLVLDPGRIPGHAIVDLNQADFLIIGGGLAGNIMANRLHNAIYYLHLIPGLNAFKEIGYSNRPDLEPPKIVILEKDPDRVNENIHLQSGLSRFQWTNHNNVLLAKLGARLIRDIDIDLNVFGQKAPDIDFTLQGTLMLSDTAGAPHMLESFYTQEKQDAKVRLYRGAKLRKMFPWLNPDGIELASYSLEDEGFYDTRKLLECLQRANVANGVKYVTGELTSFKPKSFEEDEDIRPFDDPEYYVNTYASLYTGKERIPIVHRLNDCEIKVADFPVPVPLQFFNCYMCCGASTKTILDQKSLQTDHGLVDGLIPIEPRVRNNFLVYAPDMPILDMPMLVDPSGILIRRVDFNGHYLIVAAPQDDRIARTEGSEQVDWEWWKHQTMPRLVHRIPNFKNHKVESAWCTNSDINTFDYNPIIGPHPYFRNLHIFGGFGGHGVTQMMGAADIYTMFTYNWKLTIQGMNHKMKYSFIDDLELDRYKPDRIMLRYPMREQFVWG